MDGDTTVTLRSLHPRVQVVWIAESVVGALVFAALAGVVSAFFAGLTTRTGLVAAGVFVVLTVVGSVLAVARYRRWRYALYDDHLYLERGVFTRVKTVVPFVRVQHVDARRGPVERLAGLATSVVYTAGSRGADVTIPGLTPTGADDLQDQLKRLAIDAEPEDAV
ncbi:MULTISPECIES: PH domain-containing protein [unclassified Haladaptatus]|uniref:PH domain-containing protein n=1 Tax=unclassified Haladaptatus TaxID=2622732 RepID=UPI0023E846A4|nr:MULTISPECIES: PH domain-containing protein [unclassified Haladaptatus]